jgi:ubiquinone/menaquinone biosynthesis methyltransferase
MGLRASLASPSAKRRYVRTLFATIAERYDLITVVLSYGLDRRWKRRLADLAAVQPGQRALDLACGTGDIAIEIARRGGRVVGLDVTPRMIDLARVKSASGPGLASPPTFLVGDMMALPFEDASFDLVTAGYGLRNVPLIPPAAAEILRVLRPGGRLLSLDFDRPQRRVVRWVYLGYLTVFGSVLGLVLHGDADTYRYIPESIRRYPGASGLSRLLTEAGFSDATHRSVLGGLLAISEAGRPAVPPPPAAPGRSRSTIVR